MQLFKEKSDQKWHVTLIYQRWRYYYR